MTHQADASALPLTTLERRAAKRLGEWWPQAPHFHLHRDVAIGALRDRARHLSDQGDERVTLTALLVHVVARVLLRHPRLNSTLTGDTILCFGAVNLGVAVATESGLVVPVIAAADSLREAEIAAELKRLRTLAHEGRLRTPDVSGGTFTISNLGMFDIDAVDPIVNPSQAAILGIGRTRVVPSYDIDGTLTPTPLVTCTLGVDHRAVDGAAAARFLADFTAAVEGRSVTVGLPRDGGSP